MWHERIRAVIQLLYFLFLPSAFTAAFAGVKYIFTTDRRRKSGGDHRFVTVLLVLCGYTIVFGRFFCGFACAFGSLGMASVRLMYGSAKSKEKASENTGALDALAVTC